MKKLICNIVSFAIATALLFIPLDTRVLTSCIALSVIDPYFHKITFCTIVIAFYLVTAVFFILNAIKKDKFDLYKWSCLVFFCCDFLYVIPKSTLLSILI